MVARLTQATRVEGYRLLMQGRSAKSIADTLGVGMSSVKRWAKLAGMKLALGRHGGAVSIVPDSVEKRDTPRAYRRLTLSDRVVIETLIRQEKPASIRSIAGRLDVSPSTVSREIQAHRIQHRDQMEYDAGLAHYRAMGARSRTRPGKLENPGLRDEVVTRLNDKYSPEQIAGELKVMFPDQAEMRVSHETIYQALYVQGRGGLRHELTVHKALRSGRTGRKPQSKLPARNTRPWLDGAKLADRPPEAEDRAVPGHWEGDLVVGPENSGIVTLVERRSRYTLIGRLPGRRDSETVTDVLAGMIEGLPEALKQTVTWDQGTEMASHAAFTVRSGCPVYFCDPHSPWQRPTNENTNGLIRDFYPKGTNFNKLTTTELAETQRLLNIRPRKIHGFRSPAAIIGEELNGVALTD